MRGDVSQERDTVLLTCADFLGTLAAARCHGQSAIPVTMAGSHFLAPSIWSKYVGRRLHAPAVEDSSAFVRWLITIGRRDPGMILYPTSDGMAWLISQHREALSPYYR